MKLSPVLGEVRRRCFMGRHAGAAAPAIVLHGHSVGLPSVPAQRCVCFKQQNTRSLLSAVGALIAASQRQPSSATRTHRRVRLVGSARFRTI